MLRFVRFVSPIAGPGLIVVGFLVLLAVSFVQGFCLLIAGTALAAVTLLIDTRSKKAS